MKEGKYYIWDDVSRLLTKKLMGNCKCWFNKTVE